MIAESSAFHTSVFDALCACFGLNKNSADAIALIHEAYAEPENVPRPARNRNVIYWTVTHDTSTDPVSTEHENASSTSSGSHLPIVYTTLKYLLIIVCYGPASEEYAHRIRSMLYLDGSGFPRQILRQAGIFPVPEPPMPIIGHEEDNSFWRKRADLTISLRVRDEQRAQNRNSLMSAPGIILRKGS